MNPEELEFWNSVKQLLDPVEPTILEYRLYYNDLGEIVSGSMIDHAESGQYIVVDKSVYDTYYNYRVVDGQIKKIDRASVYSFKLKKSNRGQAVVQGHASLVVEPTETHDPVEYYEYTNC